MKNFCLAFTLCMASLASAQDSVRLLPTPLEMPARIGPLVFDGKPHKYEPAALGYSYQYNGSGLSLTVYVYDAGATNIPDGGDTVPNCYIFEQTKREIAAAGYSDVRLVSEQLVRLAPPDNAPLAREAVFEFVRGDQYIPPYETELSAFRSLLAMNLPGAAGNLSRQLAPVAEAGFLEEFVWVELHRNEWGSARPDGLAVPEYQTWKETNLKEFRRPQPGAVIINRPRPMKIEAPPTP